MKNFNITPEKKEYKINRSRVFKRAHYIFRNMPWKFSCFGDALRFVYQECRDYKAKLDQEFIYECEKIKQLYYVEQNINIQLENAFSRGEKIYVDGY